MFPIFLTLLISIQTAVQPAPQDEIKAALTRAEALYYEARFSDSIQLLTQVDDVLSTKPDRLSDRIQTKMQLALANIGLNETSVAKLILVELYSLDSTYALDPQQFSPKVIALAGDARAEQDKIRCHAAGDTARKHLEAGNVAAVLDLFGSTRSKCPNLAALEPDAAEVLYRNGLADYKRSELSNALQAFQAALKLSPEHELAGQYIELTQGKLQMAKDRLLAQWQRNFDTRQWTQATADYRQIVLLKDGGNAQPINHVTTEYRKALSGLVETWNQACPNDDAAATDIRSRISELLPEPSFGEDIRAKLGACTKPEPKAEVGIIQALDTKVKDIKLSTVAGCLQMDAALAMTRLKIRVEPEISRGIQTFVQNSQVTVNVRARIHENGSVSVSETSGSNVILNNAVRTAVEHWKFSPAIDPSGMRCVDTNIPIVIGK